MLPTSPDAILCVAALRELEACHASVEPPLMERAGQAAAAWALDLLGEQRGPVLVLAGPGNNGGDGFVLARELAAQGVPVLVACHARAEQFPPDARMARQRWLDAGGQIVADFIGTQWTLAVDALFGIGLTRVLEGVHAEWIRRLNALSCPVLALDIPSGLDADTGGVSGPCVHATHTASFMALKPGLLTLDGPDHCGEIRLFDLDLPAPAKPGRVLAPALFTQWLQPRLHNVHKGSFGSVGVIGGAAGMQGAALLAARAALHLGAGKVYLGLLDLHAAGVDLQQPELMLRNPGDLHLLASVLVLGPGLGRNEAALAHLRRALGFAGELLLDADALNLLGEEPALHELLRQRDKPAVLTPHPAEAARLLRSTVAAVQADRLTACRELAQRFRCVVILKGCGSVLAAPDGHWFINTSGHGGMAAGGMGDVLSGLIAALLAQGWPALQAAGAACHLHGAAADLLAAEGLGPVGLTPSETIPAARRVFNAWLNA